MAQRMEKFWMVLSEVSAVTTHRHASLALAVAEARRLAGLPQNAGIKFFVLGAEGFAVKRDPIDFVPMATNPMFAEVGEDDGIPF